MIVLSKVDNVIKFTYSNSEHYPYGSGTLEVPVNSLSLFTDSSDMATFKKAASNDVFICATYSELGKTKSELESWFKDNMVSTGGGSTADTAALKGIIDRSISAVTIPSDVTSIGEYAFFACSGLTSADIPSGVTSIGSNAFRYCSGLTSVDIPSGVTSIGSNAFRNCSGLSAVTVNATTPPTLGSNAFNNGNTYPIYVPCESVDTYKAASGWSDYGIRIQGIPPCEEPPTPIFEGKWKATYGSSNVISADCDATSAITTSDIVTFDDDGNEITELEIGDCVTSIALELYASTLYVTVRATIPPTLTNNAFDGFSGGIYVPSESVTAYQTAWSRYADRIQAITT